MATFTLAVKVCRYENSIPAIRALLNIASKVPGREKKIKVMKFSMKCVIRKFLQKIKLDFIEKFLAAIEKFVDGLKKLADTSLIKMCLKQIYLDFLGLKALSMICVLCKWVLKKKMIKTRKETIFLAGFSSSS